MIVVENQTSLAIPLTKLEAVATHLTQRTIELMVVDTSTIQEMNFTYRGVESATDVLSFPLLQEAQEDVKEMPLGSIVLCDAYIQQGATTLNHTLEEETILLFIHGLLHLLGYDHERDSGEMRAKEEALIKHFGLPQSLIVRNSA
jgi:probable rRNA maturation factor